MENFKFKVKFKGWGPRYFESYDEAMTFIKKANVILDDFWLVEMYDDGKLILKTNSFDFNNIKLKAEFPKTFKFTSAKGAKVEVTLEEDTDDRWYIIISTKINGEETKKVRAGISSFVGKNGVFLVYTNPKTNRKTAICLNDCPKLLKYLFYIGKNRNLLENYI